MTSNSSSVSRAGLFKIFAKVLSVVDIYDALVTARPYKKAFSQRDAVGEASFPE